MKVMLDPGHGGRDYGAVANNLNEKDVNLEFFQFLKSSLYALGATVGTTRATDRFVSLGDRVSSANRWKAEVFISIHANAAESPIARGFELFTTTGSTAADEIATRIYEKVCPVVDHMRSDFSDGDPDKEAGFYVIRNTEMPAVLLELGFLTNKDDAKLLADPDWLKMVATHVAQGIVGKEISTPPPGDTWRADLEKRVDDLERKLKALSAPNGCGVVDLPA